MSLGHVNDISHTIAFEEAATLHFYNTYNVEIANIMLCKYNFSILIRNICHGRRSNSTTYPTLQYT